MTKPPKSRERKQAAAVSPAKGGTRPGPKIFLHFLVLAISCALLAAIVFIALLTIQAEQASGRGSALDNMLKLTVSQTLTLVSLLQGLLALSVTLVLTRAFHYLQWGLSARTSGLPYLDFLALSPMTLEWGLVLLFVSSTSFASARMWSGLRYVPEPCEYTLPSLICDFSVLLFALVWLSGIVLFCK
jgi:hypothetical protein